MSNILSVLAAILLFGVLILVHEGGHFFFARLFKVKINEFAIGMGPKIVSKVSKKSGIRYSWRAIPIGGFVNMGGEEDDFDDPDGFAMKPVWQRIIITIAGAAVNILFGILLMAILVFANSDTIASRRVAGFLDGGTVYSEDNHAVYGVLYDVKSANDSFLMTEDGQCIYASVISIPDDNGSAHNIMTLVRFDTALLRFRSCDLDGTFVSEAKTFTNIQTPEDPKYVFSDGTELEIESLTLAQSIDYGMDGEHDRLSSQDVILEVNGKRCHIYNEMSYQILHATFDQENLMVIADENNQTIGYFLSTDILVERNGEEVLLNNVLFPTQNEQGIVFGDYSFQVYREEISFVVVIKEAYYQAISTIRMIWDSLFDLITGHYGLEALSGPVGVTKELASAASASAYQFFYLAVVISMNLGIMNLLPLPALDGGKLVFQIIELVIRKPVKRELEATIHFVGIIVLLLFMLFITCKDVFSLFV